MKKLGYVVAAIATIAIAAPSIASAETVVVKHGGMHRDHGWHHGWHRDYHHHDRVVVVHRHHHDY
jgi:hypothetical protein